MKQVPVAIDVSFDMRSDTPAEKDPDSHSPTLRAYHQALWSKALPSGAVFTLDTSMAGRYLHHASALGDFTLTSDSVIPTYEYWQRMKPITNQLPGSEIEGFLRLSYTIGGMMVFPGTRVEGVRTINGERGLNSAIGDRMDLTLECIRRYYLREPSPMDATFRAYANYFDLFGSFLGFVEFFYLEDLLHDNNSVSFFLPFNDFVGSPLPGSVEDYREYRKHTTAFVEARNARIAHVVASG